MNLNDWGDFRTKSLQLSDDLVTMVGEMEPIIAGDSSDTDKRTQLESIMGRYLP